MFYAALCDMTLYMYSDENSYKRSTHCSNVIHLHHSVATKAGDYIKKNHVFRLQTADIAQYLIQTRFLSPFTFYTSLSQSIDLIWFTSLSGIVNWQRMVLFAVTNTIYYFDK